MRKKVALGLVVLVVFAVGAGAAFVQQATKRVQGNYFDSNGVRIHYTEEGSGTPLILIHGFAANADLNWRKPGVTDALAKDYRVISLDNRGHGLSDKPHDSKMYGVEMVNDVKRLMDHLEIEKAHIVGYSMGGFITLKFLSLYPERVISAAPCGMSWQKVDEKNSTFFTSLADSLERDGSFRPLFERLTPIGEELSEFRLITIDWAVGLANDKAALASLIRSFGEFEVPEETLKSNKIKTLTCVGSIDPLREGVEKMHELMPQHELVIIDGADHLTTIGRPEYIAAISDFLKGIDETGTKPEEATQSVPEKLAA